MQRFEIELIISTLGCSSHNDQHVHYATQILEYVMMKHEFSKRECHNVLYTSSASREGGARRHASEKMKIPVDNTAYRLVMLISNE